MNLQKLILAASLLLTGQALGQADEAKTNWQDGIVLLDVTRNNFNFRIPWDKRAQSVSKFGAVIEGKELLTTAAGLANHTLVRLQKGGRGKWTNGEVKWIDYQANLAIIGVNDDEFWEGLRPLNSLLPTAMKRTFKSFVGAAATLRNALQSSVALPWPTRTLTKRRA